MLFFTNADFFQLICEIFFIVLLPLFLNYFLCPLIYPDSTHQENTAHYFLRTITANQSVFGGGEYEGCDEQISRGVLGSRAAGVGWKEAVTRGRWSPCTLPLSSSTGSTCVNALLGEAFRSFSCSVISKLKETQ